MLTMLNRILRPALKVRNTQLSWRHKTQIRACAASSATFQPLEDCLVLNYGGTAMHLNYVWLRDHCRSAASYNSSTNQRNLDTGSIDLTIRPDDATVQNGHLILTWPGGHVSKYSLSWLAENSYEGKKQSTIQPRILWNSHIYEEANIPSAKWDTFMSCDDEVKKFLQNYLLYGIAFVDDVPATVEATEAVTQRVSLIRETTYGRMWCFTSDFSRGDTAYSQLALDRHTDTSYFQEPCGYNNYDRSVINTVPHDLVQRWYEAHRELTTELRRPENELWVKLTPGKVIFIDNWRVMHGRDSFTGLRQLCGCYLTRDDVLSSARCFGLQA
ncbi:trimethyllysine dioxygenase, mitochondrial isoform X2 [Sander lucioperca]|uniref:trimethyllysine dioxygenase, mitochondrial isoform X2 n=1 Tax=Sander lucioperca TaxID=283035 RepID=UPI00125CEA71|nr:trimethyllysine dioxygenase, mitochondrial isoform X2 [Sander lucioperca]